MLALLYGRLIRNHSRTGSRFSQRTWATTAGLHSVKHWLAASLTKMDTVLTVISSDDHIGIAPAILGRLPLGAP